MTNRERLILLAEVFRGFTAAASLKIGWQSAGLWRMGRVFRGFTAAASLKYLNRVKGYRSSQAVFRGFTAAASLKFAECIGLRRVAPRRFPRFHRRGLIEGCIVRGQAPDFSRGVFRGFTAAASLKDPNALRLLVLRLRVFRGFTAAASLKDSVAQFRFTD